MNENDLPIEPVVASDANAVRSGEPFFQEWTKDAAHNPASTVRMATYASDADKMRWLQRQDLVWPHMRPDSVFMVSIGNNWQPGAWQKVADMAMATNHAGHACWFEETYDACNLPFDQISAMRDAATMMGRTSGAEWLCLVENDVLPEPDTLVRLMSHQQPVIAPLVTSADDVEGGLLHGPKRQPNTGIHPVKWAVTSFLLIKAGVFNCLGTNPWSSVTNEGVFFNTLAYYGHRAWIDTDTIVPVATPPSRPMGNYTTFDERIERMRRVQDSKQAGPDRSPIDPDDPRNVNGFYAAWIQPGGVEHGNGD